MSGAAARTGSLKDKGKRILGNIKINDIDKQSRPNKQWCEAIKKVDYICTV